MGEYYLVKMYSLSLTLCRCVATLREAFFGAPFGAHFFNKQGDVNMTASETISLISIIASSLVGVLGVAVSAFSLIAARKDKEYMLKHTERLNEQNLISEIIANYISAVSIAKLGTILRRAAAVKAEESVSDFMKSTEKTLAEIDAYTVEIVSVKELSENTIREDILELRKRHIRVINRINDLKAYCSKEKHTSTDLELISREQNDLEQELKNSQKLYNQITDELYVILKKYVGRVEWSEGENKTCKRKRK